MSIDAAMARIVQIQTQLGSLTGAFQPQPAASATGAGGGAAGAGAAMATASDMSGASSGSNGTSFASALAAAQSAPLSAAAQGQLTSGQQQFAARLATDTGLDRGVVSAWLLAEESGGAAQSRQSAGNNDWLNVGYTDSGTYGSSDSIWADPTTAADATAGWLKGQNTIPGYGTASAGVQGILAAAGQPPAAQISALQNSGWASSGYPSLPTLYQQLTS